MERKLNKLLKKLTIIFIDIFLIKNTDLIKPMLYGLFLRKKIRSKILFDVGSIFKINKKTILQVAAVVNAFMLTHSFMMIYPVWIMII